MTTNMKKVILYGAGRNAVCAYQQLSERLEIICFADNDVNKQGTELVMQDGVKLPVLSLTEAMKLAEYIYVTIAPPLQQEVISELINKHNVDERFIINKSNDKHFNYSISPVSWSKLYPIQDIPSYRNSCRFIEHELSFSDQGIPSCCNPNPSLFRWNKEASNRCVLEYILTFRHELIAAVSNNAMPSCNNCSALKQKEWGNNLDALDRCIIFVGGVCQFNCIYCKERNNESRAYWESNIPERIGHLNRVLDLIEYLISINYIHSHTEFFIANGEITVNPLRDRIYSITKKHKCTFLTNAELFSEEIAESLDICNSTVNVSLDAGTKETYKNVKGKDCFNTVKSNIEEYSKRGKIILKYIILPGINTNNDDAAGFVNFAAKINATIEIAINYFELQEFNENIDICVKAIDKIVNAAKCNHLSVVNRIDLNPLMMTENRERINKLFS